MNTASRDHALQNLPPPLQAAAIGRYDWVRTHFGVDETSITTFEVEGVAEEGGLMLRRQVWWFEEETMRWILDESNEWWLHPADSENLLRALSRHLPVPPPA